MTEDERRGLAARCAALRPVVYRFVRRMGADREQAEDITQETLTIAIKHIDHFRGDSQLATWLLAIAKREVWRSQRGQHRDLAKLTRLRAEENLAGHPSPIGEPEKTLLQEEVKNGCLHALLTCLPFSQRSAFTLSVLMEMPSASVARIMRKSPNAIHILVSRAKASIREFLCGQCEHLEGNPGCRCENMLHFSMVHGLINRPEQLAAVEAAKVQFRKFHDEIELFKSLPPDDFPQAVRQSAERQTFLTKK